jgi:predicted DNA-binding helix-hairpin-helix protein
VTSATDVAAAAAVPAATGMPKAKTVGMAIAGTQTGGAQHVLVILLSCKKIYDCRKKINISGKNFAHRKKMIIEKESYPEVTVFAFCSVSPTIGC